MASRERTGAPGGTEGLNPRGTVVGCRVARGALSTDGAGFLNLRSTGVSYHRVRTFTNCGTSRERARGPQMERMGSAHVSPGRDHVQVDDGDEAAGVGHAGEPLEI